MATEMKVLHYINQFFGGIGGEEVNDIPVETREGAVGPGRLLDQKLGDSGSVVATVIAGDNYFIEEEDESVPELRKTLERYKPDLVVAGPAFDAGRYGMACALVCNTAKEMGIPAVTGMVDDNAGVLSGGREIYVVPTGENPADMSAIIDRMVVLGLKLANGEELGHADVDDYLPHGFRREIVREKPGAERAVDMALALALGQSITPEIKIREYDFVPAPAPIQNLKETTVALVTTAGLVPRGNPDGLQGGSAPRKFVSYDISDFNALTLGEWESVHGGFKGYIYNSVNPNYALPLPALRGLEALGVIKGVHKEFFSTAGASCPVTSAQEMGREITRRLVADEVQAVILESTWGSCNRCGATLTKELEREGIAVAMISALPSVPLSVGAHRVIKGVRVEHLCGDPSLSPEQDAELMLRIARTALDAIQTHVTKPTLFDPSQPTERELVPA